MKTSIIFVLLLVLVVLSSNKASAFSVSPMTANFELTGQNTSVVYTLTNPSDESVAVEIKIESRSTTVDGKEINGSSLDTKGHFTVFPAATLIPPKQKKGIRVVYVGPKDIEKEVVYRINIIEKPMKDSKAGATAVRMLREFRTTAYVTPKNANADLKLIRTNTLPNDVVVVFFKNEGKAHKLVKKMTLKLRDELGNSAALTEVNHEALSANFLAGEERRFELRKPMELKGKDIVVSLELAE